MLRIVWILMLGLTIGQAVPGMMVLMGDRSDKTVRIASLKLRIAIEETPVLERLFAAQHLHVVTRRYGDFRALTVEPIGSRTVRNAVMLALGSRYPDMFLLKQTIPTHTEPIPRTIPAGHTGLKMDTMDWAWLMILGLALFGLGASILQRRYVRYLSRRQTHLREDQEHMNATIDGWKDGQDA